MENVEIFTPYSRQKQTRAMHYYGKRRGFHPLQPTERDPSDTLLFKMSRISRLTADRRRPQRCNPIYGKRLGFHALQPTEGDPSDALLWKMSRISRLTADRKRPQRYTSMENVKDFTPNSPKTSANTIKRPNGNGFPRAGSVFSIKLQDFIVFPRPKSFNVKHA
jgi:hypothetical protein